jgi:4'-phosphopantetheinyl transferase EntD
MSKHLKVNFRSCDVEAFSRTLVQELPSGINLHTDLISKCQVPLLVGEYAISYDASPGRKKEFIAGRNSLRLAVNNFHNEDFAIGRQKNGMPILPNSVVGSLSHKFPLVSSVAAKSIDYKAIGIDLDVFDNWNPKAASTFTNEQDLSRNEHLQLSPDELYSILFSVKESTFKALSSLADDIPPHILNLTPKLERTSDTELKFTVKWEKITCSGAVFTLSPWIVSVAWISINV